MSKTATAKTNGHSVDAIRAVAHKAAPRSATKASLADVTPARTSVTSGAPKPAVKPAVKTAAKSPAKPAKAKPAAKAALEAPARKTTKPAVKTVAKKAAAVKKTAPKAAPKATRKAAAKPVAAPKPKAGVEQAEAEREKMRKPKLVRDSFTMPEQEYAVLAQVKKACLKAGFEIKKSELLRIGVALINQIDMATLKSILAGLPQLKTGRPKSN